MTDWAYDAGTKTGRLVVTGSLTIMQVGRLRDALLQGFAEAVRVVVDLGGVGEIDIAGLQLLCAARRFAREHGKELQLTGPGDRLCDLARSTGFWRSAGGEDFCFSDKIWHG